MPRYTTVYRDFLDRLSEVKILRVEASKLERARNSYRNSNRISAYCRSSIVLLSSHVEAYVKELGEHTLDRIYSRQVPRASISARLFYYASQSKIDNIKSTNDPEKIAKNVFSFVSSEGNSWQREGCFPTALAGRTFNTGYSNPTFKKTKKYFHRFGYDQYHFDIKNKLSSRSNIVINNLDAIVDTRNAIAHGDPSATKTPSEISAMIDLSIEFARATDDVFATWCKENLCSIR